MNNKTQALRSKEALRLRILQLCRMHCLSVHGLCRVCGITQSTMNNIICGRNNSTTIATVQKICDGLEMDLPEFFDCDLFRNLEQEIC